MGWFILKHIFSTILSIINITRLSNQEDLEILILRQQLSSLQRKHDSCAGYLLDPPRIVGVKREEGRVLWHLTLFS
jgi:hypothetical protein